MEDLEERIDRLESRFAIAELVAAYCAAVDAKDAPGLGRLFTEDAEFGELVGAAAIEDFFAGWMADWGPSFHSPHAHTVEFAAPDSATGTLTAHAEQRGADQTWVMGIRYHDRYRRQAGTWRFAGRRLEYVYRVPADEYPRRFGEVLR